jgi:putative acetyltransferase
MNIEYRAPAPADLPTVHRLISEVLGEFGLITDLENKDTDITDIQAHYIDRGGFFEIVVIDGKLAGTYGIYRINDRECELRRMFLLLNYRKKGIGRVMLQRATEAARQLGYSVIRLETNRKMNTAMGLYRTHGFVEYDSENRTAACDVAMRMELSE